MPKSFIFLFLVCSLFSLPSFSQKVVVNVRMDHKIASPESDTIYYDLRRKLTWDDFKGRPDMNHKGSAVTSSGFAYSWNGQDDGKYFSSIFLFILTLQKAIRGRKVWSIAGIICGMSKVILILQC